jgi:hypothetical protein
MALILRALKVDVAKWRTAATLRLQKFQTPLHSGHLR